MVQNTLFCQSISCQAIFLSLLMLLKVPEINILHNLNYITVTSNIQDFFSIPEISNVLVSNNIKTFKSQELQ